MQEIRTSPVIERGFGEEAEGIITAEVTRLQRFVKTQFCCIPERNRSPQLQDFIAAFVTPCVRVAAAGWNGDVVLHAQHIATRLRSGDLRSMQDLNLKLGCCVATGAT